MVKTKFRKFTQSTVADVFNNYPEPAKTKLLSLRELILNVAEDLEAVGEIEETLKWGQPSYLTKNSKTGSPIRICAVTSEPNQYALYVHCQTNLVQTFKQMYVDKFIFSGKRALLFNVNDELPEKELSHCIAMALTYHLNK